MAARITTQTSPGTKVVPVALLLSLALAVGVWLVPMPFLRAEKHDVEVKAIDIVKYRVEIEESILQQESTTVEGLSEGTTLDIADVELSQRVQSMHKLTISVFLWEPRTAFEANVPIVQLTRHYYPFLQDEDWVRNWLLDLIAERTGTRPSVESE